MRPISHDYVVLVVGAWDWERGGFFFFLWETKTVPTQILIGVGTPI